MAAFLPIQGFLGTGGTFEADLNLVLQFLMGGALVAGGPSRKTKTLHSS